MNQLTRTLLRKYDCGVRPVNNWTSITTIWTDEFLVWDPEEFDGINEISLSSDAIWTPDVIIRMVKNYRPMQVVLACSLEMYAFPFDKQNCSLTFRSWLHSGPDPAAPPAVRGGPADPQYLPDAGGRDELLSASGQRDPHRVFFAVSMAMLMLSLTKSILVVKLLHHSEAEVRQMSVSACLLDKYGSELVTLRLALSQEDSESSAHADWLALCSKLDGFLFRFYLVRQEDFHRRKQVNRHHESLISVDRTHFTLYSRSDQSQHRYSRFSLNYI
ncbi:hypothetical protein F7725_006489 [Dissostichus mawsoni]|uniref:Neurotransmitter-gated ion-channel ligand-binding domain-containing protein n=1 Tax=Dissostichus mawsoni TaxID=36200 RepID=A0A7J5XVQ1_DISMA|nr:hypothetical protein F7725_006489 [Dissostichus mawsoni]